MEKPEAAEKVTFLWNDVATVADDNCAFVVCKSLVKLSPELPAIGVVEKIEADSVTRRIHPAREGGQEIDGEVALRLSYATAEEEAASVEFALPFRGAYTGSWERANKPQVVYLDGQSAGFDHVLLETVLAVPQSSRMSRAQQTAVAHFRQEQRLELAEGWPDWVQLIGTQVSYSLQSVQKQGEDLLLAGEEQIRLLYAAGLAQGEKVMYYPLTLPFNFKLTPEEQVLDDSELTMGYIALTAHLLNERQAVIDINGVVQAPQLSEDLSEEESRQVQPEAEAEPEAVVLEEKAEPPVDRPIEDAPPEQMTQAPAPAEVPQTAPIENQPMQRPKQPPQSQRPRRPSKRDNLLKYMRTLDRGVRTPQCSRNIALGQEEAEATTEQPEG